MLAFRNVMLSLVRPDKGLPGAAGVLKWLWVPLVLMLVASVAIKAAVGTPLSIEANQRFAEQQMAEAYEGMPEEERRFAEEAGIVDEELMGANNAIVSTAAMVFAVVGAVGAILYVSVSLWRRRRGRWVWRSRRC